MTDLELPIRELVDKIERSEILLPEMQRKYVWKATQVSDLLDSLYRGYPSGTILTWQTDSKPATREFAVEQQESKYSKFELLLDGQQRLTCLSALLKGKPVTLNNKVKRPIDILFNLEHPESIQFVSKRDDDNNEDLADANETEKQKSENNKTFAVKTAKLANSVHWVSVRDVFCDEDDKKFLKKAGVEGWDDKNHDKYRSRLQKLRSIKEYKYRVTMLDNTKSYEEVTEIFVRVNSLGAKLRSSDLALAQITAKWPGSLSIFQSFEQECYDKGFPIDLAFCLKNLVVFLTNQSRYKELNTIPHEKIKEGWSTAKVGIEFAINFLRSNVKVDSPSLLSSNWVAVVVAIFGSLCNYKLTLEQEKELRQWVIAASIKGRFSRGSSETLLDQDLTALEKNTSVASLFQLLDTQVGRREILSSDLTNRNSRSSYFKSMYLAFRNDGAVDWHSSLKISWSSVGKKHQLQFHHIFPKAVLAEAGTEKQKINDICNLAFIDGLTNRRLGTQPPIEYFPKIIDGLGEQALRNQCIPIDKNLWRVENYDDFLEQRRELVTLRLNQLLKE